MKQATYCVGADIVGQLQYVTHYIDDKVTDAMPQNERTVKGHVRTKHRNKNLD